MKKNILITGAAGNLGKATVERFIADGYSVIATVTPGKSLGYATSVPVEVLEADLTNELKAQEVVSKTVAAHKTIDAAILLVGGFSPGKIIDTDQAGIRKMFALNFESAFLVAKPVFLQMMKQPTGGRIVFVGARPALQAKDGKNMVAYGLSKSLIFKLSEYLNAEGATKNVVSTVVVPSTIDTLVNRKAMPNADFSSWVSPESIAGIFSFIASAEASALRDPVFKMYGNA